MQSGVRPRSNGGAHAAVFILALVASGCSGGGLSLPSTASSTQPAPSGTPSFGDKIESFFSSSSATSPQTVVGAAQEVECPLIDIRQGASTLIIGPTGSSGVAGSTNNGAMAVKYQGSFVRAARECALVGGNVVMKIGVEGRIVVGPAGGPGEVNVPLRIAVVDETPNKTRPIVTKFVQIPVTIASASDNPTFTHIEEGMSFPMPRNIDSYVVYIGFDPLAAQPPEKPKPKPKARPTAKPAPKPG
jgi:hypothetical protein